MTADASGQTKIITIHHNPFAFSLHDMRLFHDFLTSSYPHLPLESDKAWMSDVPVLAQQHDFLMHAMLALGAAHLHSSTNLDLQQSVLRHRAMALQGLNCDAPTSACGGQSHRDQHASRLSASLATCYALTFTASYMSDPLEQFLVLVRACSSLTGEIVRLGYESPLLGEPEGNPASAALHVNVMRRRFKDPPALAQLDVDSAGQSLRRVEEYCAIEQAEPFQRNMLQTMQSVVANVAQPFESYCKFIHVWNMISFMSAEDFATFTDRSNMTSVLLQAHFLALEAVLQPWLAWQLPPERQWTIRKEAINSLPPSVALRVAPQAISEWPWEFLRSRDELSKACR